MKIAIVTPGIIPIPPNGWGAIEKLIWEYHCNFIKLGHESKIVHLDELTGDEDVVHIHVANLANIAHEQGIPYYFTMSDHHTVLYGKGSLAYEQNYMAMKNAKKAFVGGKFLVEYFDNIPEYYPYGVNPEYFSPSNNLLEGHRLLCVANNGYIPDPAYDRKGFGFAIAAAQKLGLPITIAGPSNNKHYFAKNPPTYDKLNIVYDLNEEELLNLYREHTIFLHPSELETGHPNLTLLEAMACGLPVVGTIENNNILEGMEIIQRDADSVVTGIQKILSNYQEYSEKARKQAEQLSWYNSAKSFLKAYETTPDTLSQMLRRHYHNTKINPMKKLIAAPDILFNNINGMTTEILGGPETQYNVRFIDKKQNKLIYSTVLGKNSWARTATQYYTDWKVIVEDVSGSIIREYDLNLTNARVYISLESDSLGDTLAWIPYVEEFRKKHNCKLICSTFWNNLFIDQYPEIEFVKPGVVVNDLLAMYKVGLFYNDDNSINSNLHPSFPLSQPLQKWATDILGLEYREIKPRLKLPNISNDGSNQVTIAIHSTTQAKYWNNPTGWQTVVDWLKQQGYTVKLLSKEPNGYMGNTHPMGIEQLPESSLDVVMQELKKSKLFIGLGSGLSWLSWAMGVPTMIISGFSDPISEPTTCIRISAPVGKCHGCFNRVRLDAGDWNWCPDHKNTPRQYECSKNITSDMVITNIQNFFNDMSPETLPQEIDGWFSYEDLYNRAVENAKGGETFVEVGAWLGKSTNHMIENIQKSGKDIKFTTVDTWVGTVNEPKHQDVIQKLNGEMFPEFVKHLVARKHHGKVELIKDTSRNAASQFVNNSIDYIMIDGDHSYEAVKDDLHTWFHKVKPGGIISGDDYRVFSGVTDAVNEFFYGQVEHINHSFVRRKPRIQIKHMLNRPTDLREIVSVESIKQLQRYGFDYQVINNGIYDGSAPREFCRRPEAVNIRPGETEPGLGWLTGRHYGCYLSHTRTISSMDDKNFDYTIIFEGDAFLSVGVEEFANMIYKACFISERDNVYYIGLSKNTSIGYEKIDDMFDKTAHTQDLAHAYMIPNRTKQWWLDRVKDCEWDVMDLWFNHAFCHHPQIRYRTSKVYSKQCDGFSLLDLVEKKWNWDI